MKTIIALALGVAFPLFADERSDIPLVHFDLLVVSVPEAQAIAIRPELQDPAKAPAAQEKLLALVAKKEAELVGWPTLTTFSGNRAVVETIHELRYPIEFEPADLTVNLDENPKAVSTNPEDAVAARENPDDKRSPIGIAAVPTTFETRNIGVTLEIEPVVREDGETVDMQIAPNHTQLLGFRKIPVEEVDGKVKSVVEQPDTFVTKTATNLTVKSGSYTLLGFHKVPKPAGNVEITILKTTVETIRTQRRSEAAASPGQENKP